MACWGSTGCQPVLFGSLPKRSSNAQARGVFQRLGVVGRLPTTAGWQPALPRGVLPETKDLAGPDELAYVQGLISYVVGI